MAKAQPVLLEPIMKVEVSTPEEYQGDLMGDLNRRRGQIQGMETKGTLCMINAFVPLETMFGYSTDMRSFLRVVPITPWNPRTLNKYHKVSLRILLKPQHALLLEPDCKRHVQYPNTY